MIDKWIQKRLAEGLGPWNPQTIYHLRGVPDEEIDIFIDTPRLLPGGTA